MVSAHVPRSEVVPLPRIAVLSDIHGNGHALRAVLADVARAGVTEWWCLGDLVGYGAEPEFTLTTCMSGSGRCLAGNHDLGATGRIPVDVFTSAAHDALVWTRRTLGPERLAELDRLRPADPDHQVPLYHASPRDPVWEYVLTGLQAQECLELVRAPLTLIGHTHVPVAWRLDPRTGTLGRASVTDGPIPVDGDGRWLVNPGSVGQPRDGDPRASWGLLDTDEWTIEVIRTPYDIAGAQDAIRAAGLPARLATRLADGE